MTRRVTADPTHLAFQLVRRHTHVFIPLLDGVDVVVVFVIIVVVVDVVARSPQHSAAHIEL